jgi:hypothetical protein
MRLPSRTLPQASQLTQANQIDAQALAGNQMAKRRVRAIGSSSPGYGTGPMSATMAAMAPARSSMSAQGTLIRADIAELRTLISKNEWPAEFSMVSPDGRTKLVTLESAKQADSLLQSLQAASKTATKTGTQQTTQKTTQSQNTVSNVLKMQYDLAQNIVRNIR